jgi:porin-like protein
MNMVKSLILGSAAGLVAMGGAQAADLPVKAKAVEYVKICSLYGAGFYYIPGTDTCIKLGGYLRVEVALGTNSVYNWASGNPAGAHNQLSNYYTARSREDFNIDTRTATEYGVVRTYFDATFSWTTGGYTGIGNTPNATIYSGSAAALNSAGAIVGGIGNPNDGGIAGGSLGVYYAFIQFAGFTMGKAVSQFDTPWVNYPGNNYDGLVGGGGTVTGVNQFTYTAQFGNGVSLALSAQDQVAYMTAGVQNLTGLSTAGLLGGAVGVNNIGGSRSPDLIAALRVDQAWGLFQASFAAHLNTTGYYGATEITGHPDDKWGWAAQLALSIKNIPTGAGDTINVQGVYTDGATRYNFQSLAPVNYLIYGGTNVPGLYQSIGVASAPDTVYFGTNAANGSQQETIKTWGFRGAYTHNWDPYWNTAIYGAYASVSYGNLGKNTICAFIAANQAGVTNCNPDFNIGQFGIITRWTPVKNLTFSADFTWSRLDQKYAGVFNAAQNNASAKPGGAVYEIKDQDSLTLLLRAQRNW